MKKLARLVVLVCLAAGLLRGVEWGLGKVVGGGPARGRAAHVAYASVLRFDVFRASIDIEEMPQKENVYYLPLQMPIVDLRRQEEGDQLIAVQQQADVGVLTVFESGRSHAVRTYTFLAPEIADHINREGLWDKIFGRGKSPYFYR